MRSPTRTFSRLAMMLAVALPFAGMSPPAHATVTATGDATFNGTAFLPKFPCPPPPPFGTGPCSGTFSGHWTGHLVGISGTSPYDVTWTTSGAAAIGASFTYAEWNCSAQLETALGIAIGTGTATVNPGQLQGKWQVVGETFARDIIGVSMTFNFAWTRLTTAAAITMTQPTLKLNVSGLGWQTVLTGADQHGVADFTPTSSSATTVPSCATPLTNVNGVIEGNLAFNGVS